MRIQSSGIPHVEPPALRKGLGARRYRYPLMQTMPLELPVERTAADAEQAGGDGLITADLLQRTDDVFALDLDEGRGAVFVAEGDPAADHTRCRTLRLLLHAAGEITFADEVGFRQDACPFNHVPELPNVAVPAGIGKQALGAGRQPHERFVEAL